MLRDVIGWKLVEINNDGFKVRGYRGATKTFQFITDQGDCCGYADVVGRLLIETTPERMPVITKVTVESESGDYEGEVCTVTFFGEDKKLAEIHANAGSGSGYEYGACASVKCVETGDEEVLASW